MTTTLGKYDVLMPLAMSGQVTQSYLATQKGFGGFRKLVVIKEVLPKLQGSEAAQQAFLKEVRAVAGFHHPNVADVYDLEASDGKLILATEFVPGATLEEIGAAFRSSKLRVPLGLVLMAVRDAALALHYAHHFTDALGTAEQVAHGAMSARVVQVTFEGITKILDFGSPKPPAAVRSPQADLRALGAIIPEVLAETPGDTLLQGRPDLTPELRTAFTRLGAEDPKQGFATALDFVKLLETVAGPVLWRADQSAALVQRMFAERRQEIRELLVRLADPASSTAVMSISKIFSQGKADPQTLPPVAPEDMTRPRAAVPMPPGVGGLLDGPTQIRRSGERPLNAPREELPTTLPPEEQATDVRRKVPERPAPPPEVEEEEKEEEEKEKEVDGPAQRGGGPHLLRWGLLLVLLGGSGVVVKWRIDPEWIRARSPKLAHALEKLSVIKGFPQPLPPLPAEPPVPPALSAAADAGTDTRDGGAEAVLGSSADGGSGEVGKNVPHKGPPPPPTAKHHRGR